MQQRRFIHQHRRVRRAAKVGFEAFTWVATRRGLSSASLRSLMSGGTYIDHKKKLAQISTTSTPCARHFCRPGVRASTALERTAANDRLADSVVLERHNDPYPSRGLNAVVDYLLATPSPECRYIDEHSVVDSIICLRSSSWPYYSTGDRSSPSCPVRSAPMGLPVSSSQTA